jgi:hypothetical protein
MRFEIHLSMDGAAFRESPQFELADVLENLAVKLHDGFLVESPIRLRDRNGNRVGFALVTDTAMST